MRRPPWTLAPAALLVLAAACSPEEPAPAADPDPASVADAPAAAPASTPEVAHELGVPNARMPRPGLLTAGQVSPEQMDALADAGYERFISLRPSTETGAGWEEAWAADRPVAFERVPVGGAPGLTRENVDALDRLLDEAGDRPTVVYCGSSNRVGAMLALRAHWLEGVSAEEALELGRAAGMTGLEPEVRRMLSADGR